MEFSKTEGLELKPWILGSYEVFLEVTKISEFQEKLHFGDQTPQRVQIRFKINSPPEQARAVASAYMFERKRNLRGMLTCKKARVM